MFPTAGFMETWNTMFKGTYTDLALPPTRDIRAVGDFLQPKMDFFFTVTAGLVNPQGSLHGGAIATLVDHLTSAHLTPQIRTGSVSVDLHVAYHAPAAVGDEVRLESHILRVGNRVCFTEAKLYRTKDGVLIATSLHTKAVTAKPKL